MKSYTLDKINEARDALIRGDQLGCMAVLNDLAERMERIMNAKWESPKSEIEYHIEDHT